MTCKAIIMLTRRDDTTHDEFREWWLGEHAPLARQLPGVRRAVFNVVDDPQPGDPDGVSELWFDSRADFDAAYATEAGQAVVADTLAHVATRHRVFVDEQPIAG